MRFSPGKWWSNQASTVATPSCTGILSSLTSRHPVGATESDSRSREVGRGVGRRLEAAKMRPGAPDGQRSIEPRETGRLPGLGGVFGPRESEELIKRMEALHA